MTNPIPFIPVDSSFIKGIRWRPESLKKNEIFGYLDVQFHVGPTWRYSNVHKNTFREFHVAESKGKFYCDNIKGNFPSEKLIDIKTVGKIESTRTVNDLVNMTKECFIRQIEDIKIDSVISEIECDSFPLLTGYEIDFINSSFDKIKNEIMKLIKKD
jgi:hypothetical protein